MRHGEHGSVSSTFPKEDEGVKGTTTFRRLKGVAKSGRPAKVTRANRHTELSTWQRSRYEQAPEMIGHMLHVR